MAAVINSNSVLWALSRKMAKSAYKVRGFARLADFVRQRIARTSSAEYLIKDYDGDLKFSSRLNDHIGSFIFWKGTYSGYPLEWVKFFLKPDDIFLDIGANQGEYTVQAAKIVCDGRVYAFEPSDPIRQALKKNIALNNFQNVTVSAYGLGSEPGVLPLYAAQDRFSDGTFHNGLETLFPSETRNQKVGEIQIVRLDDYAHEQGIAKCRMIKIDTEGAEFTILTGGQSFIRKNLPVLILEFHSVTSENAGHTILDLWNMVVSWGYRIFEHLPNDTIREFDRRRAETLSADECINVLALHTSQITPELLKNLRKI